MNLVPLSFLFFLNRAMSIKCWAPSNLPSSTGKIWTIYPFFIFHLLAEVKTWRKYHQNWDKKKCINYLKKRFMPIAYLLKKSTWLEHILHGRPISASCWTKGEFKHLGSSRLLVMNTEMKKKKMNLIIFKNEQL